MPSNDLDSDDALETPQVVAAVERDDGAACSRCRAPICGHEVVLAWVLGFKQAPHCAACLARGLARDRAELIASVKQHVDHRECWSTGWRHAGAREATRGATCAVAAIAGATIAGAAIAGASIAGAAPAAATPNSPASVAATAIADRFDAGDLGCGDLVLELRLRLRALPPDALFEVIARDPGAPADLPAWCGLTGHALVSASHPRYLIRSRKE